MLKIAVTAALVAVPTLAAAQSGAPTSSQMTSEQPGAGIGATGSTPSATGDATSGAAATPMGKAEAKKHRSGSHGSKSGGSNTNSQPH